LNWDLDLISVDLDSDLLIKRESRFRIFEKYLTRRADSGIVKNALLSPNLDRGKNQEIYRLIKLKIVSIVLLSASNLWRRIQLSENCLNFLSDVTVT
jgi:hypothetical protein